MAHPPSGANVHPTRAMTRSVDRVRHQPVVFRNAVLLVVATTSGPQARVEGPQDKAEDLQKSARGFLPAATSAASLGAKEEARMSAKALGKEGVIAILLAGASRDLVLKSAEDKRNHQRIAGPVAISDLSTNKVSAARMTRGVRSNSRQNLPEHIRGRKSQSARNGSHL